MGLAMLLLGFAAAGFFIAALYIRLADAFRARVIDASTESFIFELTGATDKLDAFLDLMRPLGLAEVSRTGVAAIARGKVAIE